MPITTAYMMYSELFDRKPSWEDIIALIKELPMLTAAVSLVRVNMALRYALQEHNRPNFGRLQQIMFNDSQTTRLFADFRSDLPVSARTSGRFLCLWQY